MKNQKAQAHLQNCQGLLVVVGVHGVEFEERAEMFERLSNSALLHQLQQCAVDVSDLLHVAEQLGMNIVRQYAVEAQREVEKLKNDNDYNFKYNNNSEYSIPNLLSTFRNASY